MAKKTEKSMLMQHQIRQNADEISTMLQSLGKWEKSMKSKDDEARKAKKESASLRAVRSGAGTIRTSSITTNSPVNSVQGARTTENSSSAPNLSTEGSSDGKSRSAAKHTYDVGYKKWEKFDVEAALANEDNDEDGDIEEFKYENDEEVIEEVESEAVKRNKVLTPATLAMLGGSTGEVTQATVPKARGVHHNKDAETIERERGNIEFAAGQFPQAVKTYTKCLGLKKRNYIAFSNRAMAYLKMKEYIRAEGDCNSALTIESTHVKSLVRRATARNALGKHRAALQDLYKAVELTQKAGGNTKQHRADLARTQELVRQCVTRAPLVHVNTAWASGEEEESEGLQGPDLPSS